MIVTIGLKFVALSSLRLPGDFGKRMKEPRVLALAHSIDESGLIHEPLVRKEDMRVICGLDRVAVYFLLEHKQIKVKLIECTDTEAARLRLEENIVRRHDPEERRKLTEELVSTYTEEEKTRLENRKFDINEKLAPRKLGRPKHARTIAMERAAAERGVKPESIRQMLRRARLQPPEPEMPLETFGMLVPDTFRDRSILALRFLNEAALRLQQALSCLTQIETNGLPFPAGRLQRLRQETADLGASVRNARPVAICPFCKCLAVLLPGCPACAGTGIMLSIQDGSVPTELLDTENPRVQVGGHIKSVWDYVDAPEVDANMFGGRG